MRGSIRHKLLRLTARAGLLLALALGLHACATANKAMPGGTYVVIAPRTPFYRFGPMQNTGPDAVLELGQTVTLESKEYGYSRFRTAEGVTGYAATNDFQYVPPTPKPRAATPTPGARSSGRHRGPAPASERKLDIGDVPAPEMPAGGQESRPGFRLNVR